MAPLRLACIITNTEYRAESSLMRLPRSRDAGDAVVARCEASGYQVCLHLADLVREDLVRELGQLLRQMQHMVDGEGYSGMQLLVAYCGHGAEDGLVVILRAGVLNCSSFSDLIRFAYTL